ncbi:MAG: PBSX family phage terminase large subunit [Clostridiales bacterium]|nr:PBSX family phage terminase large subunit [Clostridiales bacterium]
MNNLVPFSPKQLAVLTWWCDCSAAKGKNGIICDGAVRSGKTVSMSISFISWAFYRFSDTSFAICGKTIASLKRNVITPIIPIIQSLGFHCDYKVSKNLVEIQKGGVKNRFYLFGGRDESSASLIQGMTLGGVFFDEVALMPRSFVEQAIARCSLSDAKFWFNCNPEHPFHWFYKQWIEKRRLKNMLYIHFKMADNPSLSKSVIDRYKSLYSGAFYERFVEGKWVAADGLVYPMFDEKRHVKRHSGEFSKYYLSCDYGTVNPFSLGLWGKAGGKWCRTAEFYHSSRDRGMQLTDEEYYSEMKKLAGGRKIEALIIDPSAASFIETVRRHGEVPVIKADNNVLKGINLVCTALREEKIYFDPSCTDCIREFSLYRWDDGIKKDAPKKENDHAMDDVRYFVSTVIKGQDIENAFSIAVERK